MKVTAVDRDLLANVIEPLDTPDRREAYRAGQYPRSAFTVNVNKRYRWDLYWVAVRNGHTLPDSTNGYNDAHIDTALRSIVRPL